MIRLKFSKKDLATLNKIWKKYNLLDKIFFFTPGEFPVKKPIAVKK